MSTLTNKAETLAERGDTRPRDCHGDVVQTGDWLYPCRGNAPTPTVQVNEITSTKVVLQSDGGQQFMVLAAQFNQTQWSKSKKGAQQ